MWKRWLVVLLTADVASAHAQDATPAQIDWIRRNAVAFDTVKAGRGFEDLQPLRQLIGDARIVALGEPTHGSREVFQMNAGHDRLAALRDRDDRARRHDHINFGVLMTGRGRRGSTGSKSRSMESP